MEGLTEPRQGNGRERQLTILEGADCHSLGRQRSVRMIILGHPTIFLHVGSASAIQQSVFASAPFGLVPELLPPDER
jgi:hypothetical protein